MLILLAMYLKGRGLVRHKTPHFGSFFVIGTRHSTMSNRTMNQYHPQVHQYGNIDTNNLSIGPWVTSLLNSFKCHASILRSHCDMVMDGLCKMNQMNKTMRKSWGIVTWRYSNTNHMDNDWNHGAFSGVIDFITKCGDANLFEYLTRYKEVFQKDYLKKQLTLSTCGSWLHKGWHDDWLHI